MIESGLLVTLILFGCLFLYLALGLPLAFVLGGVGMIGCLILWGPTGFMIASSQGYAAMGKFTLISIPLFVLMAMLLERSGVAEDLYTMMHNWLGPLGGGLAIGTVIICTIFAAMSGISGAATVSMGIIALPQMLRRNYEKKIAMGSIAAGGALGILIPPSVIFILYGTLTGVSIGGLFMGGILPGLVLSGLFISYIGIRCWRNPRLGPPLPVEERANWQEKVSSLQAVALPMVIIILVLGGIYFGVCTPSEAAALGVLGAVISAAVYRKLSWILDERICLPDRQTQWNDYLDIDRGILFHCYLPSIGSWRSPHPSDDGHPWRTLCDPGDHAVHLLCPWLHPRPSGHHHDLHTRISSDSPNAWF